MTSFASLIALVARPPVAIGLSVSLACAVAIVTLTPSQNLPSAPGSAKMHHVIAFASLAVPLALARPRAFVWIVLLVSAYGALIELIQPHVGRHGSFTDALATQVRHLRA